MEAESVNAHWVDGGPTEWQEWRFVSAGGGRAEAETATVHWVDGGSREWQEWHLVSTGDGEWRPKPLPCIGWTGGSESGRSGISYSRTGASWEQGWPKPQPSTGTGAPQSGRSGSSCGRSGTS